MTVWPTAKPALLVTVALLMVALKVTVVVAVTKPNVRLTAVPSAVAGCESVNVVPVPEMAVIVVPAGMPGPLTGSPTTSDAAVATSTVIWLLALVVFALATMSGSSASSLLVTSPPGQPLLL
jgi:hypothetical protein